MRKSDRCPAFAALPALLGLLAACSLPPYNEDLSLAQVTKSKMDQVNFIGPVYSNLDDRTMQTEFYYLPDRNDPADGGGFLVNTASYGLRVWYLADSSSSLEASWPIDLDNESDTSNNYLLQPIESATGHYLSLARAPQNDLRLIYSTDPSNVVQAAGFPVSFGTLFTSTVAGTNIYPDSTAGADLQYFLCYSGPGIYKEAQCSTNTGSGVSLGTPGPTNGLGLVPDDLTNAFYCHDPAADKSYLSYWSDSAREYRSYSWTWDTDYPAIAPTDFRELPDIKGRIDAVLTSGQLLSFKNGACTVYSSAGKKLYRFPLGGLKFCYERYDAGTPKLYFSLAYWLYAPPDSSESDRLYIEVYAIPTADLADLD
jgi:hypothetical protein